MDAGDVVQYGLYAITVALGIALLLWMMQARRASQEQSLKLRKAEARARVHAPPTKITAVRGLPSTASMSEALAGIRLPVHWQPDPPVEVQSTFTLTTNKESAGDMAETLTSELARLGYRITPTGAASARAVREDSNLTIEVDADADGSFISSRITLVEGVRG